MTRHFSDLQLGSVELFCLTAQLGSFTSAASEAGVTPAAVSRSISRLEARLGVRLFVRTTRKLGLTDAGRVYFAQCQQALTQLIEAEREITGKQIMPAGLIRMSLPTPYGQFRVLPLLTDFREQYPQVEFEVHLSNRNIDFVGHGYDLAIRARRPPDSGLIARKLEDAALVVVAAPEYLQLAGIPKTLEDLADHECIQFVLPSSGRLIPWLFLKDGSELEVATKGACCCSEELLGGVALARSGAGLYQIYRFIVEKELQRGELQEVLESYAGCSRPFSILYPHKVHMPLRVRTFIDYLLCQLASN